MRYGQESDRVKSQERGEPERQPEVQRETEGERENRNIKRVGETEEGG